MTDVTRTWTVRLLDSDDLRDVMRLLSRNPVQNVFVLSRVRSGGVEEFTLGCPLWGYEVDGELEAICHAGSNLVPVNADDAALDAFVEVIGERRTSSSIVGPAPMALALWQKLSDRWGSQWTEAREVRRRQPVMVMDADPTLPGDPRVQQIALHLWEPYFEAAVKMYTEEVGVSPVKGSSAGYRYYVRQLITSGRAFGIEQDGEIIFKADLGSVAGRVCQVQGVWVHPDLRGQGIAAPAMSTTVRLARKTYPIVSLYVNDFNAAARATYARAGFRTVDEFATVLF